MSSSMSIAEALAKSSTRVITHMNDDHADSLLAYAIYFAGLSNAKSARMSALNVEGFVLDVVLDDGTVKTDVLIRYTSPLESAAGVRKLAVAMHFEAYNGLGMVFKIRNNFYGRAVVQAWTHMPAKIKYPFAAALFGVIGFAFKFVQKLTK